jgi:hypothetical protein
MHVGAVKTAHPKAGQRGLRAPPAPTAAIKAMLPKLADLPKEAEQELRTVEDLKKELASLRRELKQAHKGAPAAAVANNAGELRAAGIIIKRLKGAIEALMKFVIQINAAGFAKDAGLDPEAMRKAIDSAVAQALRLVDQKIEARVKSLQTLQREGGRLVAMIQKLLGDEKLTVAVDVKANEPFSVKAAPLMRSAAPARSQPRAEPGSAGSDGSIKPAQQKILDKLAWLEQHDLHPAPKETLAAVCGVSPTSGGYFNNLGALRSAGLIDYPTPGAVAFTDEGRAAANASDDDRPVHEHWLEVVTPAQRKILEALIARHPQTIEKDALAGEIDVSPTSGGFFNNLGRLRTLGAIDYPQRGTVALTRHVMP